MARVFRSGLRAWQWLPSVRNFLSLRFRTASLSTSPMLKLASKSERVDIMFIDRDGDEIKVKGPLGENLLDVAHENGIELEGACEGVIACSTCHLVVHPDFYDKIDEGPTEEELDMLDLAYGLTDTSRLGCQVMVTKELDKLVVTVPSVHRDARKE